jgi:hypothetical protein
METITVRVLEEIFYDFLATQNIVEEYCAELNAWKGKTIRRFIQDICRERTIEKSAPILIDASFSWDATQSGFEYWADMQTSWFEFYDKHSKARLQKYKSIW